MIVLLPCRATALPISPPTAPTRIASTSCCAPSNAIEHYPIFGIGVRNFPTYSLIWHDVHMTYLQVCAEGGIAVLILYLMFFYRDFKNLKALQPNEESRSRHGFICRSIAGSQVGFVVGACFAPEAYQFFPYFAVAFTATLLQTVRERQKDSGARTASANEKAASLPGGLCRSRNNRCSLPCPLTCRQFCVA